MSILAAIDVFKRAGVLKEENCYAPMPIDIYSFVRDLSYEEEWEICREKYWFHAVLVGEHVVRFEEGSFRFLMSPYVVKSFDDFVAEQIGWDESDIDGLLPDLQHEYELFVSSERLRVPALPVRMDYHERGYRAGVHSACHMHIGIQCNRNELRIPLRKKLTHKDFALFILRNFYPVEWGNHLSALPNFDSIRKASPFVDGRYWNEADDCQVFLG